MMSKRRLFPILVVFCAAVLSVAAALADLSLNQQEINVDFIDSRITSPRSDIPVPEPAPDYIPAPAEISGSAVRLELKPASGTGKYSLWINGNELAWGQDIASAVGFCEKSGIAMERFDDGNGHSGTQEIALMPDLPLMKDYAFYVDQGAGPAEGQFHTVRMYFEMSADPTDAVAREAQDIFNKLEAMLGKATEDPRVYAVDSFLDLPGIDLAGAVRKMYSLMNDGYSFVSAGFSNLSLYVSNYDGRISIYLNLGSV